MSSGEEEEEEENKEEREREKERKRKERKKERKETKRERGRVREKGRKRRPRFYGFDVFPLSLIIWVWVMGYGCWVLSECSNKIIKGNWARDQQGQDKTRAPYLARQQDNRTA